MHRRTALIAAATAALSPLAIPARAQGSETLRLVVPYPPGGSSDHAARIVADKLGQKLGQTVIVENKAGAGGRVALQQF